MNDIICKVRERLIQSIDEKTKIAGQKFFKEKIKSYGVRTPDVNQISKDCLKELAGKSKTEIFELCDELWQSGNIEESVVACNWIYSQRKHFEPTDFEKFKYWIDKYVNNWASCDTFCNHSFGYFIELYPEYLPKLKEFTASKNRWMRRAAAVTLIIPAKKGLFLNDIFEISDSLLTDSDDLVQKGYGWLLKSASKMHQKEVFNYVMKNKSVMPRTSLRYAIEKLPKEMKTEAMKK